MKETDVLELSSPLGLDTGLISMAQEKAFLMASNTNTNWVQR